ncbi:hypothetical protein R1flu_018478 [Riccia fluitans]|uniref:Uncharacterized protein n=1 Tax=Riccia fluitans TaxID=41844 RepID=A0ABD1ZG94_9MARC
MPLLSLPLDLLSDPAPACPLHRALIASNVTDESGSREIGVGHCRSIDPELDCTRDLDKRPPLDYATIGTGSICFDGHRQGFRSRSGAVTLIRTSYTLTGTSRQSD